MRSTNFNIEINQIGVQLYLIVLVYYIQYIQIYSFLKSKNQDDEVVVNRLVLVYYENYTIGIILHH